MATIAMATATTHVMATVTATRWQATKRAMARAARMMMTMTKRAMATAARAMATAPKRAMATDGEGNFDNSKSDGNGNKEARA
jgi:hypothetical protein